MESPFACLCVAILLAVGTTATAEEPAPPVSITVHHRSGLSAGSDPSPTVILFGSHTHFHLKITNGSGEPLTVWQPGCPEGDLAMTIEFRFPGEDEVHIARIVGDYTGGSGLAKSHRLAAGADMIVDVDFLLGWTWRLPFPIDKDGSLEVEMRAVYNPAIDEKWFYLYEERQRAWTGKKEVPRPWTGKVTSPWEKVRIVNRTGKTFGGTHGR